jgi:hypothetical protein
MNHASIGRDEEQIPEQREVVVHEHVHRPQRKEQDRHEHEAAESRDWLSKKPGKQDNLPRNEKPAPRFAPPKCASEGNEYR